MYICRGKIKIEIEDLLSFVSKSESNSLSVSLLLLLNSFYMNIYFTAEKTVRKYLLLVYLTTSVMAL